MKRVGVGEDTSAHDCKQDSMLEHCQPSASPPDFSHVCTRVCSCVCSCVYTCIHGGFFFFLFETVSLARGSFSLARLEGVFPVCFCLPRAELMNVHHCLGIFVWALGAEPNSLCLLHNHVHMAASPARHLSFCLVIGPWLPGASASLASLGHLGNSVPFSFPI